MLILIPILILLLTPIAMLLFRLTWPRFAYHWLIAAGGVLVAWPLVLLASAQLPQAIQLVPWLPDALFPSWPMLLVDRLSWPYALALVTLVLGVILTDVARAPEADWAAWAGSLGLAALGIFAVLAGNPLTLLLAWTAIDLVELLVMLGQVKESSVRERLVIAFSARVLGSLTLVAGVVAARSAGQSLSFAVIPPRASIFLLLAAGLRLGVLPLHLPLLQEVPLLRSLGTMSRLVPVAASLALLARTATADVMTSLAPVFLGLAGLAALFGGATWALAQDELDGRTGWILGMGSLAVAAAVRAQPAASLAWGMATLLSGGLLFLTSARDRRLSWITLLGLLGFSAMPFSPAWNGARLYAGQFYPFLSVFLVAHALLLVGYLRHTLRVASPLIGVERWVWFLYPVGLALLPVTHLLFGWWTNPGIEDVPLAGWWVGPFVLGLAALMIAWSRRIHHFPGWVIIIFAYIFSLSWIYRLFWSLYRWIGRLLSFFSTVLEGDGGVLWALLVLVLLILVFAGNGGG
jgi:hypothetical protein